VLVTGYPEELGPVVEGAKEAGVDAVCLKPLILLRKSRAGFGDRRDKTPTPHEAQGGVTPFA
jgi:hypothetical protein